MHYWPSTRWGFSSNWNASGHWTEVPCPFALIGSHPRCQIHVEYKRLPQVVYFAVCCGDRIEIWPLCAIAFPLWGRVKAETQVMIGKRRLRLMSENDAGLLSAQASRPGDAINDFGQLRTGVDVDSADASLVLDWGSEVQYRKLTRRVSVVGERHPSLMRMDGLGLRDCELGIVCVGKRVWAVQLNPSAVPGNQPLVRELVPGGESVWVGNVHLWANEPGSYSGERFGVPVDSHVEHLDTHSVQDSQHRKDPFPVVSRHLQAEFQSSDPAQADEGQAVETLSRRGKDADSEANHYTDRLLEKAGRRASRQVYLKWGLTGGLVLCALMIVAFIVVKGVLPIFQTIYSD